jgi:aminoglycoside phosphotransferase (APT) family kinase protein
MQVGRAAAIDDEPWAELLVRTLTEGADGWCLHEPLRTHSALTRRLLDHIERIGREVERSSLPETDLVHGDFHHRNVLQHDDGRLSAVIDWEGVRQGDAVFDLVMLAICLAVARVEPGVESRVWEEILACSSADSRAAYVAQVSLRRLDWSIRHHPDEVGLWQMVAERELGRFG